MVKQGIVGRIVTEEAGDCSFTEIKFRQAKWHRREKLPTVKRNSIYIPLSKPQLSRLARYTGEIRATAGKKYPASPDGSFGYVALVIDHSKKQARWHEFEPFETKWPVIKSPAGIGIGDLMHYAIVKHLKEQYKNHVVNHVPESVSADRLKQLERMGIDVKKTYKMRDYHDKVRAYIERVRREKRATVKV